MCSMKWVIPSWRTGSSREPQRSHTPSDTERRPSIASVSNVIPDGRIDFLKTPSVTA